MENQYILNNHVLYKNINGKFMSQQIMPKSIKTVEQALKYIETTPVFEGERIHESAYFS